LALTDRNELYAWGSGTYGENGQKDFQACLLPKLVKLPTEKLSEREINMTKDEFTLAPK
jgi:hypothetical protein